MASGLLMIGIMERQKVAPLDLHYSTPMAILLANYSVAGPLVVMILKISMVKYQHLGLVITAVAHAFVIGWTLQVQGTLFLTEFLNPLHLWLLMQRS